MPDQDSHPIEHLLAIMRALRDPVSGCPWDRAQTFASIAPYTVEEAYEVADAIAHEDIEELRDELGDLLLQVVYHAQMAAEQDQFEFVDVINSICAKMVRRHPHVFAAETYQSNGSIEGDWERIKQLERDAKSPVEKDTSILANLPTGLPPLIRARKLQKKAAHVNFDWPTAHSVLDKIQEELDELRLAMEASHPQPCLEEEVGDLLFSVVNICRHLQVDAELAIQKANTKFEARFRRMEKLAANGQQKLADLGLDELDSLWKQVKASLANDV